MKVDEIISLPNGKEYGLLLESTLKNEKYFLAVLVNENEEPTNEFCVFKEVNRNGELAVLEEKDPLVLNHLLKDYNSQMEKMD